MPLLQGFKPAEAPKETLYLKRVEPIGIWMDLTEGSERYVVARPATLDYGGEVFIVPFDSDRVIKGRYGVHIVNSLGSEPDEFILPGLPLEIPITNTRRQVGQLVLQHVLPDGTLGSLS